jgi:putative component of membrane protein insertase Oxa1/YidC/SpoIIIJ protein YidD
MGLAMGFKWVSIVTNGFSHGFQMGFHRYQRLQPWVSNGFPSLPTASSMGFKWVSIVTDGFSHCSFA